MSEKQVKFARSPHVTSFDDVFSDEGAKYLGRNGKKMSTESGSIIFTIKEDQDLNDILTSIKKANVTISHTESRKSRDNGMLDVYIECEVAGRIYDVITHLKKQKTISNIRHKSSSMSEDFLNGDVPWFPRCLSDLDRCGTNVLMYGSELDADHPGFKDTAYRERRTHFSKIAMNYKNGEPIPRVEYTEEETQTWKTVYNELMSLYPRYACKEHVQNIPMLAQNCGFTEHNIPQLEDVSRFLQKRTGFRLRPVAGFLRPRDFLAGLAFRVFNCTQYIRHPSDPMYTPEPDVCHELLGHVPLLAEPSFAQFSHEIGLASLGASEEDISKLAACYLYTVEFGLCKENGQVKAYGAGLLSCIAELKHALTSPEKIKRFDPEVASKQEFYVTTFQPVYFLSDTLEQAKDEMRKFAKTVKRPFSIRYDLESNTVHTVGKSSAGQCREHATATADDNLFSFCDDRDYAFTKADGSVTIDTENILQSNPKSRKHACDVITDVQNNNV